MKFLENLYICIYTYVYENCIFCIKTFLKKLDTFKLLTMSPVIWCIKNKLTWMASRLRWMNNDKEILMWTTTMQEVFKLLVEAKTHKEVWQFQQPNSKPQTTGIRKKRQYYRNTETKIRAESLEASPRISNLVPQKSKDVTQLPESHTEEACTNKKPNDIKVVEEGKLNRNIEQQSEMTTKKARRRRTIVRGRRAVMHKEEN